MEKRGIDSDKGGWETLAREIHFRNEHIEVATEEIKTPSRESPQKWTVTHRKRAVIVAPITTEGKLILIRQERIPIRETIWEVPAGQVEEDENVEAVALRELREETGFELAEGGDLIALGDYFSSPGFTDEHGYFFVARPVRLTADGHTHQESESILECLAFSPDEIRRMIASNEIRDANTLAICAKMTARGIMSLTSE